MEIAQTLLDQGGWPAAVVVIALSVLKFLRPLRDAQVDRIKEETQQLDNER